MLLLPPELIHRIADYMKMWEVKVVRLTCKQLSDYLETKVLQTIFLNLNVKHLAQSAAMLRTNITSAVANSSRRLIIGSPSPIHDADFWGPFEEPGDEEWVATRSKDRTDDIQREGLSEQLINAIQSLHSIHTVIWRTEYEDTVWDQSIITAALVKMPHLQRLDAMLAYSRVALPLQDMRHLREISLSEGKTPSNGSLNSQTRANLAQLIANSPPGQITRIQVGHGYYDTIRSDAKPSLHELLQENIPHLQLRHLGITNAFVKLDGRTIPHMRNLTSLNLSRILQPSEGPKAYRRKSYRLQPIDPSIYKTQRNVGSTVNEIWTQLAELGIRLVQITISEVAPAFLAYLQSYSGLKGLSLSARGFASTAESDALALPFFERALPCHAGTLQQLMVEAPYEGLWCFGDYNISVLSSCTHLRQLRLSLGLETAKDAAPVQNIEDNIDALINMISTNIPRLSSIRLDISNLEKYRRSFGLGTLKHFSSATKRVLDHIHRLAFPVRGHLNIPDIYVGPTRFEPERVRVLPDVDSCTGIEWQWRYRLVSRESARSQEVEASRS